MWDREYQICSHCVMDTSDSKIVFDEHGVCDYCNNYYNEILPNWSKSEGNEAELEILADRIRQEGKGKKYDCIIGMSGGVDSSYLCYVAKEKMKLRPLIYSVDTGWNLNLAEENIRKVVEALDLDLHIETVNPNEMKDLQLAFLKSQVPYQDFPQDHAIFAGLYNFAVKNKIKYVLTGANNATEGIRPPIEWVYINDIKLMKDIHKKFGQHALKTFPMCGMFKYRLYYAYILGMRRVAPLDYIPYDKNQVERDLQTLFGWQKYENKHYESIFTRWYEGFYLPTKFGYDKRRCYFSNLILTGVMSREEAIEKLRQTPYGKDQIRSDTEYIAQKLGISLQEMDEILKQPNKTYKDYKNAYGIISKAIKFAQILGVEKRTFR